MRCLRHLDVAGNALGEPFMPSPEWESQSGGVNGPWEHQDGWLVSVGLPPGSPSAVVSIAGAVAATHLLDLNISRNSLYAFGALALAKGLRGHRSLRKLDVSSNAIVHDISGVRNIAGFAHLATVLTDMQTMRELKACGNTLRPAETALVGGMISVCAGTSNGCRCGQ